MCVFGIHSVDVSVQEKKEHKIIGVFSPPLFSKNKQCVFGIHSVNVSVQEKKEHKVTWGFSPLLSSKNKKWLLVNLLLCFEQ